MSFGLSSHVGCLRKCRKRKQSVDLAGDAPGRKGTQTVEEKRGFEPKTSYEDESQWFQLSLA